MAKRKNLNQNQRRYLHNIYYNTKSGGNFSSPKTLMLEVKRRGNPENIAPAHVKHFLNDQLSYVLLRDKNERVKKPSYISYFPGHIMNLDLSYMGKYSKENNNYKYIFACVDSFSRKSYVRLLKNKDDNSVVKAMESMFDSMPYNVLYAHCDLGSEFRSKRFVKLMRDHNCKLYYSQTGSAYYCERFFKTLKSRISRYMLANNTSTYYKVLPQIVDSYNATPSRALYGLAPNDINRSNQYQMYLRFKQTILDNSKKKTPYRFKIGDKVLISLKRDIFHRQMSMKFSFEIFEIIFRYTMQGVNLYKIASCDGQYLVGTFYESELHLVPNPVNFYQLNKVIKNERHRKLISLKYHSDKCQVWVSNEEYEKIRDRTIQ